MQTSNYNFFGSFLSLSNLSINLADITSGTDFTFSSTSLSFTAGSDTNGTSNFQLDTSGVRTTANIDGNSDIVFTTSPFQTANAEELTPSTVSYSLPCSVSGLVSFSSYSLQVDGASSTWASVSDSGVISVTPNALQDNSTNESYLLNLYMDTGTSGVVQLDIELTVTPPVIIDPGVSPDPNPTTTNSSATPNPTTTTNSSTVSNFS